MVRYDASDVNSEFVSLAFDLKGNRRSLFASVSWWCHFC